MFQSFNTTGIGSLPHTDAAEACRVILDSVDIPFWPQLPHRSFLESMVPMYSEGFPFIEIEGDHVKLVPGEEGAVTEFYEKIAGNSAFPISKEYSAGFHTFLEMLEEKDLKYDTLKGHITGPLTFTLGITDNNKRPIYFDDELRDLSLELLKGKVRVQIEALKKYADNVIIFADEPILTALGTSTYIGVNTDDALRMLQDIVSYIKECGGISAIHCCGRADWPVALSSGIDIFNFDAYEFGDTLGIYPDEMTEFIDRGGCIAWGVVPTTEKIKDVTLDEIRGKLESGLTTLENAGIPAEKLRAQSLITPSCGTGSLSIEDAMKAFSLLKDLRNSYVKG